VVKEPRLRDRDRRHPLPQPRFVVEHADVAGERVRTLELDTGPNADLCFHVVGTQFDTMRNEGRFSVNGGTSTDGITQGPRATRCCRYSRCRAPSWSWFRRRRSLSDRQPPDEPGRKTSQKLARGDGRAVILST